MNQQTEEEYKQIEKQIISQSSKKYYNEIDQLNKHTKLIAEVSNLDKYKSAEGIESTLYANWRLGQSFKEYILPVYTRYFIRNGDKWEEQKHRITEQIQIFNLEKSTTDTIDNYKDDSGTGINDIVKIDYERNPLRFAEEIKRPDCISRGGPNFDKNNRMHVAAQERFNKYNDLLDISLKQKDINMTTTINEQDNKHNDDVEQDGHIERQADDYNQQTEVNQPTIENEKRDDSVSAAISNLSAIFTFMVYLLDGSNYINNVDVRLIMSKLKDEITCVMIQDVGLHKRMLELLCDHLNCFSLILYDIKSLSTALKVIGNGVSALRFNDYHDDLFTLQSQTKELATLEYNQTYAHKVKESQQQPQLQLYLSNVSSLLEEKPIKNRLIEFDVTIDQPGPNETWMRENLYDSKGRAFSQQFRTTVTWRKFTGTALALQLSASKRAAYSDLWTNIENDDPSLITRIIAFTEKPKSEGKSSHIKLTLTTGIDGKDQLLIIITENKTSQVKVLTEEQCTSRFNKSLSDVVIEDFF